MNQKEIAELRRQFNPDKSNINDVCGCYVNEKKEIVSQFNQSLFSMEPEEKVEILAMLKKTLSGSQGKNLIDINFATAQVVDSTEHRLLMTLRNSGLKDEETVQAFFERVIESITIEGNYLILLAYDRYDIAYRSKDGVKQGDASDKVFSYIMCSICPIKTAKPALGFSLLQNEFHSYKSEGMVATPSLGFVFPAFDDRSANIYGALYYTKDTTETNKGFVDAIFNCEIPMAAEVQKEVFSQILESTLEETCSYDVMQSVHNSLCEIIEEHKVNKVDEPLVISKKTVQRVLTSCGVDEEHVADFEDKYDEEFGNDTKLSPANIVNTKQFKVKTPDVSIQVNPQRSNLVETRIIDGRKYIMILVEDGVEVNGVNVHIGEMETI